MKSPYIYIYTYNLFLAQIDNSITRKHQNTTNTSETNATQAEIKKKCPFEA